MEGTKRTLEITVAAEEVTQETERVVASIQKRVRLPGFRPGKAPTSMVRGRFPQEIRKDVLEALVPKHFRKAAERDNLQVVGTPDVTDVHMHAGEPLRFKAEFEVAPVVELADYHELTVGYREPEITDEDVAKRIEEIREQKAEYVNIDPRPVENGDYAVGSLRSLSGAAEAIDQDELMLHIGGADTMAAFTENLLGMSPGEEKEFDVAYPEEFGKKELAGRTVRFRMKLKVIRRKELPELNDEFARDLGDYQTLDELREVVRKALVTDREFAAQQAAKEELIDKLVEMHELPVPEVYIDRQIQMQMERQLRDLAGAGVDIGSLKLDWEKVKEKQRPKAIHDVKASLLLDKIADREAIEATRDEVDREVQRVAKQQREPVAAMRMKLEKDGALGRIAAHIRTEKTLSFLFEHVRKEAR
ncbi:MAG: trigger factor [Bryobacteraceae bacterium]